jgi:hypothetical protein
MQLLLPTEIEGWDALTPEICSDLIYMTLDMLTPSDIWEEKWSELPSVNCINCWSPAWIHMEEDFSFSTFNVQVDEYHFISEL